MKATRNQQKSRMMINRLFLKGILIALTTGTCSLVRAETLRSGFPLMMEITDPRLLALGGAALTETGRVVVMAQNPATLSGSGRSLAASYARHPVDMWSGRLLGAMGLRNFNFGGYIQTYGYGTFKNSSVGLGETGESFEASENVIGVGVASTFLGRGSWGIAGKLDWTKLDNETHLAGAIDIGLTFDTDWENLKIGLALRNWGTEINKSSNFIIPTPTELSLSTSKRLAHLPLTVYSVANLRRKGEGEWNIKNLPGEPGFAFGAGGEFEIHPSNAEKPFLLRFGYRSIGKGFRVGNSDDTFAGFSFGLGLFVRQFEFDYAFAPLGALGQVHRLGISKSI